MNPVAFAFWALLGIIGYLAHGVTGALIGVAVGLTLSIIVSAKR